MMRLIGWFAGNHVAANLLVLLIVASGLLALPGIRQEPYPNVAFDLISITVPYPGAAPDEVEEAICIRIEEAIHDLEGIRRIESTATEGLGSVLAEIAIGADHRTLLDEIQTRVEALDTLPDKARKPIVQELIDDHVLLSVVIYGDRDERTLRALGERVRDEISTLPEVETAELVGVRPYEISIEVFEADLRRHGLAFDDLVRAVRASSVDLPGGSLKTSSGEILLRTKAQAYRQLEFEKLVLLTRSDGTRLRLGDVSRVVDGFADTHSKARLDGKPAVLVRLLVGKGRQVVAVSDAVHAYVERVRQDMPEGVGVAVWADESEALKSRRDLLLWNAGAGLLLVIVVLGLFLPLRLAFWVTAGIPVAFFGALIIMALLDVSINMMSLFAFIMALGLVVDDAIIVGESIERHQRNEGRVLSAAIAGTRAIAVPVVLAVLTTVLFLVPILWLPGFLAKIIRSIPIVVIACLLFSLVESLLILPAHLSGGARRRLLHAEPSLPIQASLSAGLERFIGEIYRPAVEWVLRWPALTLSIATVILLLAMASMAGGWVRFSVLPDIESDLVTAGVTLPEGTSAEVTDEVVRTLEKRALELRNRIDSEGGASRRSAFEHVLSSIGDYPDRHDDFKDGEQGAHVGRVRIQLAPGNQRVISSLEVEERWRTLVGEIPEAVALAFSGADVSDEPPINIRLSGPDPTVLEHAVEALKTEMASYPGVREISDSLGEGKQEARLRIRSEGEAFGLTLAELARQVRQGFHGEEVQRVQRGRDDVPVVVRYRPEERRSIGDLENIWIRIPDGGEVPFPVVAVAERGRGYSTIRRSDRSRAVNILADVAPAVANAEEILADMAKRVLPQIQADYPRVDYAFDGLKREGNDTMERIIPLWAIAIVLGYAILAGSLRSYLQPLVIVAAIPFGLVGAVLGHATLGLEFTGFSLIGMVALTGVVLNDALIYVDCVNHRRAGTVVLAEALVESGMQRFRPILLTSLTTFVGLLPLLLERSAQAQWLKPLVATLAFGVMFATAITLLLVPATYSLLSGLRSPRPETARSQHTVPFGSRPRLGHPDRSVPSRVTSGH
jgi:multidrug efflux pump subunit AcrB